MKHVTVIRRTPQHAATVIDVRELTPRMRRLTLHVPTLDEPRPAQDVELALLDDSGRKVKRRYTIRHHRGAAHEIDLDALLHGHGPGARWAATARPGDRIDLFGPRGKLELTDAAWHLLVGDESALPAIAALAEAVDAPAYALVEVAGPADELPIPDATVSWLHRGETPPGTAGLLGAAIDGFTPPNGQGQGYLLGESRAVVALRERMQPLVASLYVKGYWNVARPPSGRR